MRGEYSSELAKDCNVVILDYKDVSDDTAAIKAYLTYKANVPGPEFSNIAKWYTVSKEEIKKWKKV